MFCVVQGLLNASVRYEAIRANLAQHEPPVLGDPNDFTMFLAGARIIHTDRRGDVYDLDTIVREILRVRGYSESEIPAGLSPMDPIYVWLRYYNPPIYLAAFSPLTALTIQQAYLVSILLNVALAVCLGIIIGFILRWRQPYTLLIWLALFAAPPVYWAIHHAQPIILLGCLLGLGYLALRQKRYLLAGILLSLTGIKPHWLLPALSLWRREPRLLVPLVAGGVLFLAVPFLALGPAAIVDYVQLVTMRGSGDLTNATYGTALLSWSGFFMALTGGPQPVLWLAASGLTVALFFTLWWRADSSVALVGGVLAALLIVPHSHFQDWILVAPAAAVLLSQRWARLPLAGIAAGLFAIFFGLVVWPGAILWIEVGGIAPLVVSLGGFGLLLWLTAVTYRGEANPAMLINLQRSAGVYLSNHDSAA